MKVSRTRQVTINMGGYGERYQAGATATYTHNDLGYSDEEWAEKAKREGTEALFAELNDAVLAAVNAELEVEVAEAMRIRDADEPSFMEEYEHPENPRKKRRRNR